MARTAKNVENGETDKNKDSTSESSFYMMNLFKSERTISHFFAKHLYIRCLLKGVSLTCNSDSFVRDGRCEQNTAQRIQHVAHTHIFLVCTWPRWLSCVVPCLSWKSFHLIYVRWRIAWGTFFVAILYAISDTRTQSNDYSFAALSFGEFNHCHSARRVALWPLARTVSSHSFCRNVTRPYGEKTLR